VALGTPNGHAYMVAHDMGTHHCQGFTLCGIDFARHDTAARLVLWQVQLS